MPEAPAWMRAVLRVERMLGEPLGRATNSDQGARAAVALGRLVRAGLGARDLLAARGLHLLNLPTRRDVQRLDAKVERLGRQIEDVAHTLETEGEDGAEPRR